MNDSPWPVPRVAKMRHAVVGRVHKTPPNHLPDISLSTPNLHAGVGGQRDGPSLLGLPPNSTPQRRRIITTVVEKISKTKRELTKPPQKWHWRVAFDVTKKNPKSPFKNPLIWKSYA